jgi:pilus assembly protein FimV
MLQRQFFRLSSAIVLSAMLSCAQAVELGEPLVRSRIGQPLSADIELTGIASEAALVQAALADPEVYRGANISMHPALSALNITIVRREGKRFLHLVSPKRIESEYVHLFFSLSENGRTAVRATTLWFAADPNPAPPARPAPAPAPAPAVVAAPAARPLPAPQWLRYRPLLPRRQVAALMLRAAQPPSLLPACRAYRRPDRRLRRARLEERRAQRAHRGTGRQGQVLTIAMQAAAGPAQLRQPMPSTVAAGWLAAVQQAQPSGRTPWLFIGIAGALIAALIGALGYILLRKRRGEGAATIAASLKARAFIVSVRDRLSPAKKATPEAQPAAE